MLQISPVITFIAYSAIAYAQPVPSKEGSSTHIFPAGGRRGTTVPVRVGTESMPPRSDFRLWGAGVSAPPRLETEISGNVEPSPRRKPTEIPIHYPREWQSQIEIAADAPIGPVYWRLSCASFGTSARPFIVGDFPEFIETESNSTPERAERVTIPVTINGRIAGERDVDYYRLSLSQGATLVCDLVSRRIGSPLDAEITLHGPQGRRIEPVRSYRGSDPVLAFSIPSGGNHLLRIFNLGEHGGPNYVYRMTLDMASSASAAQAVAEDETKNARDLQPVAIPVALNGRFDGPLDEDVFEFRANRNQPLAIACTVPAGSAASPVLELFQESQSLMRASSVETDARHCEFEWQAPADGTYRLRLRDLQFGAQGGEQFAYHLSIQPAIPDFALSVKSDFVSVTQGDKAVFDITVKRTGGFDGPIDLVVAGLPEGVTAESLQIPVKQNQFKLTLAATAAALSQAASLKITGRASIDGSTFEHVARAPHLGVDAEGVSIGAPTVEHVQLTVRHKPLFRLACPEAYQYAHRGTIYPYQMDIERLNGFDGEIVLQIADRQNRDLDGIEMLELRVPPGESQPHMPIYLPETMHINVQSQSQLYTQGYALFNDEQGRPLAAMVVAEKRNMIRPLPTVVKLIAVEPQLAARPGEEITCRLQLQRTANFTGPMKVELRQIGGAPRLIAENVEFGAGQTDAIVRLNVPADCRPQEHHRLVFRATGQLEKGATVVSEAAVTFRVE